MINKPEYIIIHHSATKDTESLSWQAIRKYHTSYAYNGETISQAKAQELIAEGKTVKEPWNDIGYHFGVELVGDHYEVLVGRLMTIPGAHCYQKGMNNKSIGICVIGNFDVTEVSQQQWTLTAALVSSLCSILKIPFENIHGHRDFAPKTCPGKNFDMEKFKRELM